jgi:16S rRNA (guanine527-N7)-methyltransferase
VPETLRRRGRGNSSFGSGRLSGHEQTRPAPSPLRHPPLPRSAAGLPALDDAFWRVVDDGLAALSVELTAGARAAVDGHVRLLLAWNESINLTALRTPEQAARGHVVDSLSAVATCARLLLSHRQAGPPTLLDMGSGGGFPGLPLAMVLGVGRAALVDSVAKKAAFLRVAADAATAALREAGEPAPQIDVFAERAEDLAQLLEYRAAWDLVVARAVGSLAEVVELGLPLLAIGGHVVAWKRATEPGALTAEIDGARRLLRAAGGSRPRVVRIDPDDAAGLAGHVLVTVRKARPTPDRYPRSPAERKRAALLR